MYRSATTTDDGCTDFFYLVNNEFINFQQDVKHISSRTKQHEVWLILMRLLSVLMSRTKSLSKSGSEVQFYGNSEIRAFGLL